MQIHICQNAQQAGDAAGKSAAALICNAIKTKGGANIILATGTSQFQVLAHLVADKAIEWNKVIMFHLDEYIDLPITHKASFRKYLKERFLDLVQPLKQVHLIDGENDPVKECEKLNKLIKQYPPDVALVGIGENGHLAFNDPPADFETNDPYIIVQLDQACRQQQVNEGWFSNTDEVPARAISMSVNQIMRSEHIICTVPGQPKAIAVKHCVQQPVSNLFPASILQQHKQCDIYLDTDSASLL